MARKARVGGRQLTCPYLFEWGGRNGEWRGRARGGATGGEGFGD